MVSLELNDGCRIWPKPAGVGREREPVTPVDRQRLTGRARCRMHGGARGSGGPRGKRNGNFRHAGWTRESVNLREAMRAKVREIRGLLRAIGPGAK
jgi:hypothetical protein